MKYVYLLMIIIIVVILSILLSKLITLNKALNGTINKINDTNVSINYLSHKYDLLSKNINKKKNFVTKLIKGYILFKVVKEIYDDDDELHGVSGYKGAFNKTMQEINHKRHIDSLLK